VAVDGVMHPGEEVDDLLAVQIYYAESCPFANEEGITVTRLHDGFGEAAVRAGVLQGCDF
jgi:hypothetical protein